MWNRCCASSNRRSVALLSNGHVVQLMDGPLVFRNCIGQQLIPLDIRIDVPIIDRCPSEQSEIPFSSSPLIRCNIAISLVTRKRHFSGWEGLRSVSVLVSVCFGIPCALLRHGAIRPIAKLLCLQANATAITALTHILLCVILALAVTGLWWVNNAIKRSPPVLLNRGAGSELVRGRPFVRETAAMTAAELVFVINHRYQEQPIRIPGLGPRLMFSGGTPAPHPHVSLRPGKSTEPACSGTGCLQR